MMTESRGIYWKKIDKKQKNKNFKEYIVMEMLLTHVMTLTLAQGELVEMILRKRIKSNEVMKLLVILICTVK